jgi:hypothetical protein
MTNFKKNRVLYLIIGTLILIIVGLSGLLVNSYINKSQNHTIESETETSNEPDVQTNTKEEVSETTYPSHEIKLSEDKPITIPQGWKIEKLVTEVNMLPEERMQEYNLPGVLPIHKGTEIVLSNPQSQIFIVQRSPVALTVYGFQCTALDDIDSWEIIKQPSNNIDETIEPDEYGAARKEIDNKWTYEKIYNADKDCTGQDGGFARADIAGQETFIFEGASQDLPTADELFIQFTQRDKNLIFSFDDKVKTHYDIH